MHLPEPTYPCYLPVLGEFGGMTPHEGPTNSVPEIGVGPVRCYFCSARSCLTPSATDWVSGE
ncbi:hypothetical protein GCM10009596_03120 [Arthrobacter rhombi]